MNIYQVLHFGGPIVSAKYEKMPTADEILPAHADMLRYDTAFHNPEDMSFVVFPEFKSSKGKLGGIITHARWKSFCMKVEYQGNIVTPKNIGDWITYQHPEGQSSGLIKLTLDEYVKAHPDRKVWRYA